MGSVAWFSFKLYCTPTVLFGDNKAVTDVTQTLHWILGSSPHNAPCAESSVCLHSCITSVNLLQPDRLCGGTSWTDRALERAGGVRGVWKNLCCPDYCRHPSASPINSTLAHCLHPAQSDLPRDFPAWICFNSWPRPACHTVYQPGTVLTGELSTNPKYFLYMRLT